MSVVYLDNNATTRVADEVREVMLPYLSDLYGNPSSMHTFGGQVHRAIEKAREHIALLIHAEPEEIVFTSCGTESDNSAIISALHSTPDKRHVITTRVEHPAVLNCCKTLARRGYRITFLPVDKLGRLNMDVLHSSLSDDTAVVSVMYANNESGVLFPVEEIASLARSAGAIFHTDAVQAAGKLPVNVKEFPVDMMSLSGHKMHAAKGVGALYIKRGTRFSPYIIGGHQEKGRRGGTENVASIIGFGKAAEIARQHLEADHSRVRVLRDRLEEGLLVTCPGAMVNGDRNNRLPNTLNISFEYVEGEAILLRLNEFSICASSGSACTSGSLEPSHVLRAMGVPFTAIHGSVRFSLSRYTNDDDVDAVLQTMPGIIKELRELSPYGREAGKMQNLS
ncbi:MAG: cysteine desulfurase [Nitrospira bacterium SG8_35_4]|nr:MAG: cysteine desulfurase [Nitrospira bacterium SG8_35_4]